MTPIIMNRNESMIIDHSVNVGIPTKMNGTLISTGAELTFAPWATELVKI